MKVTLKRDPRNHEQRVTDDGYLVQEQYAYCVGNPKVRGYVVTTPQGRRLPERARLRDAREQIAIHRNATKES